MKICCFSIVTYWHGIKGGMEVHGKLLSEGLAKKGHQVSVISTRHPEGKEFEEKNGVKLYYLKNTTFGSHRKGWRKESLKKFFKLNGENNFDLIWSQQAVVPTQLLEKREIPTVVIMHGHGGMGFLSELRQIFSHKKGFFWLPKYFFSFLYYHFFWERPLLSKCARIIAVSNEVARSIARWFPIDREKIYLVYNGVDTELFKPSFDKNGLRQKLGISEEEKVLLFLSFVTRQKGLHLLLRALPEILKKIEKVKLLVTGEGDYLTEAKEESEKLGIKEKVIFTGYIPHQELPAYINLSDLFVFPTVRQEGLPFALIEAMACQKPVIVSKIGGIPSVIDNGIDGILITPDSVNEIIEKTIYLLENPQIAEKIAKNAREKAVKQFNLEKMVEETIKVFDTALGGK